MSYYLVLDDDQLNQFDSSFKDFCTFLANGSLAYSVLIDRIQAEGVISGKTHNSLVQFQEYTRKLNEMATMIGTSFDGVVSLYLSSIEAGDDYLYDASVLKKRRDYSQDLYDALQWYLEWVGGEAGSAIGSWLEGLFNDVVDFFTRLFSGSSDSVGFARKEMQDNLSHLLSYNRETSLGLKNLFDMVHSLDGQYSVPLAEVVALLAEMGAFLQEMANVVDPANKGGFAPEAMKHLGESMLQLDQHYEAFKDSLVYGKPPTLERVLEYINQEGVYCYGFDGFYGKTSVFHDKYSGSSIWTTVGIAFFDFYNINKNVVINELKNMIGEDLTYEEYLELQQMAKAVDSMNKSKTGGQKAYAEQEKIFKQLKEELGTSKDVAKDIYKFLNTMRDKNGKLILDGRTKEAKRLKEFTEKLGNLEKLAKYGAKAADYLEALFADYSRQQDIIESMMQSAGDSESAQATARRLQKIYENRWTVILDKLENDVGEFVYDTSMTALSKAVPGLDVAMEGIDIFGEATGLGPQYKAAFESMQLEEAAGTSQHMYQQAVQNLKNADPNDPNYAQLVENVRNTFELHKRNLESMYLSMADSFTGEERAYYQYCAAQAREMDMNKPYPTIMSFKEYTSQDLGREKTTLEEINAAEKKIQQPTMPFENQRPRIS